MVGWVVIVVVLAVVASIVFGPNGVLQNAVLVASTRSPQSSAPFRRVRSSSVSANFPKRRMAVRLDPTNSMRWLLSLSLSTTRSFD
jgi:hypothetical protein